MSTTAAVILDTRRLKKKSSNFPVKLRVTHQRITKIYQTIHSLTEIEFQKLKAPNISAGLQVIRDDLKITQTGAQSLITGMDTFTFSEFEREFAADHRLLVKRQTRKVPPPPEEEGNVDYSEYYKSFSIFREERGQQDTIAFTYFKVVKQLINERRVGSALKYQYSYTSLKKFGGNIRMAEVTVGYLRRYETWMLGRGRAKATVGVFLRPLRAVFNVAIDNGLIKRDRYPFGRNKYLIPNSRNLKKALDMKSIAKIYQYQPSSLEEEYAKDLWFFCYFGNGMNPKDLAHLKFKNIEGQFLTFERAKTEFTTRSNPKPITAYINEDMQRIMDRWGNQDSSLNNYIFPVLTPDLSVLQTYFKVTRFTSFINSWMKHIGEGLGIVIKLTTIVSRHSFSTQLKRSGVSTEFIQEALGHTDIRTTENYLDSFENDVKKQFAGKLSAFKTEIPIVD
jgi:integrase